MHFGDLDISLYFLASVSIIQRSIEYLVKYLTVNLVNTYEKPYEKA